jgi:hypothetical protein
MRLYKEDVSGYIPIYCPSHKGFSPPVDEGGLQRLALDIELGFDVLKQTIFQLG